MEAYKFRIEMNTVDVAYIVHRCMVGDVRIVRILNWDGEKWFSDVKMPTNGVHCYFLVSGDGSVVDVATLLPLAKKTIKLSTHTILSRLNSWLDYQDDMPIQIPEPIYV